MSADILPMDEESRRLCDLVSGLDYSGNLQTVMGRFPDELIKGLVSASEHSVQRSSVVLLAALRLAAGGSTAPLRLTPQLGAEYQTRALLCLKGEQMRRAGLIELTWGPSFLCNDVLFTVDSITATGRARHAELLAKLQGLN